MPPSVPCYIYTVLLKPRLLRRLAQGVVKRFIPPTIEFRGTTIALNQDDAIVSGSLALGSYETFVTDILEALLQPGMAFFDVGANIGIYTALAARRVGPAGRVVAVEPGPVNVRVIRKTLQLNGFANVTVAACAAGDRVGQAKLFVCDENAADHRLHDPTGQRPQVIIDTVTLDGLARDCGVARADVIKVDTQGWEAAVFAGMPELLGTVPKPMVVTEYWPWGLAQAGSEPRALLEKFLAAGFAIYEIDSDQRTILPQTDLDRLAGMSLERQHTNLCLCDSPQRMDDLRAALRSWHK